MNTKKVKIYHFKPNRDIDMFLSNQKILTPNLNNSMPLRGNRVQFRSVQSRSSSIVGRLCKVRSQGKPTTVEETYSVNESELEDDIIESCHFLYSKHKKRILIQKNTAVFNKPNELMSKLLAHIFQELSGGSFMIWPIMRYDALTRIMERRKSVKQITIALTGQQSNLIHQTQENDLNFTKGFLGDTPLEKTTLRFSIERGSLKARSIDKILEWYNSRSIKEASFEIKGDREPIKLSVSPNYDMADVRVNDNGHFVSEDMFEKLTSIRLD